MKVYERVRYSRGSAAERAEASQLALDSRDQRVKDNIDAIGASRDRAKNLAEGVKAITIASISRARTDSFIKIANDNISFEPDQRAITSAALNNVIKLTVDAVTLQFGAWVEPPINFTPKPGTFDQPTIDQFREQFEYALRNIVLPGTIEETRARHAIEAGQNVRRIDRILEWESHEATKKVDKYMPIDIDVKVFKIPLAYGLQTGDDADGPVSIVSPSGDKDTTSNVFPVVKFGFGSRINGRAIVDGHANYRTIWPPIALGFGLILSGLSGADNEFDPCQRLVNNEKREMAMREKE